MFAQNSNIIDSFLPEDINQKKKRCYELEPVTPSKKMNLKCSKCSFSTSSQKKLDKHLAQPQCDSK